MTHLMFRFFTLPFLGIVLLLLNACGGGGGLPEGAIAPDFTAQTLEGKTVKLSDYKGKMVMLYFWADWCPACKKEFPATQAYYEELDKNEIEILAVNVGQERSASEAFKTEFNATFPMLVDSASTVAAQYGVQELPTNYFVNAEGKVVRHIVGWIGKQQVDVILRQNKD